MTSGLRVKSHQLGCGVGLLIFNTRRRGTEILLGWAHTIRDSELRASDVNVTHSRQHSTRKKLRVSFPGDLPVEPRKAVAQAVRAARVSLS
jgi:hypothetical protein